jgi:transcription termination/antitermination protein NusG
MNQINQINQINQTNPHWFAVHTRSRHEKYVDTFLREQHIYTFLPLVRTLSRRRDRKIFVDLPLFPGYLFVHIPYEYAYEVRNIKGVVRIVGEDLITPVPIEEKQIEDLKILVSGEVKIDPYPYLQIGKRIRVIAGPLRGIEGILMKRKRNYQVIVSLDLLQRSVTTEVCITDIESID